MQAQNNGIIPMRGVADWFTVTGHLFLRFWKACCDRDNSDPTIWFGLDRVSETTSRDSITY